jgi:hypothetical protein
MRVSRRLLLGGTAIGTVLAASETARAIIVQGSGSLPSMAQRITAVALSANTFPAGSADGTVVGAISVTLSPVSPVFSGTLALTGTDASNFRLSSTTLPSNLLLNGAQPNARTYSFNIIPTQASLAGSGTAFAQSVTATPISAITGVTLSNYSFPGGSPDGTVVGAIMVGLNPTTPPFTGTLALTGTNAAAFRLSSTTLPSNLLLNGTQAAGAYSINIIPTQAGVTGSGTAYPQTITGTGPVVVTHDFTVPSYVTVPSSGFVAYQFGQMFRLGDVPAGQYPVPQTGTGGALTWQMDYVGPAWPSAPGFAAGSLRHAVFTVLYPVTGPGNYRIQFALATGTYAPSSTPRSNADVTSHNFLAHFANCKTAPGFTYPYTWTTKGANAGNFTFSVNAAITANRYELRFDGPVQRVYYLWGFLTDDVGGAADPHLYCELELHVFSDASNPANVSHFEAMPRISQPAINPVGGQASNPDVVLGQASFYDGATKIRNLADDVVTFGPSNITLGGPTVLAKVALTNPRVPYGGEAFQFVVNSGTPPAGGPTNNQFVFADSRYFSNGSDLMYNVGALGHGGNFTYTSVGTGSWSLVPYQCLSYYSSFFITSLAPITSNNGDNANGDPLYIPGTWATPRRILPNLDATTGSLSTDPSVCQKAYWQSTGAVPGWPYTLMKTATFNGVGYATFDNYGFGSGRSGGYRPNSLGPQRQEIDGGGGDPSGGHWSAISEWMARWFVRMGDSTWSYTDHAVPWVWALLMSGCAN